jgi:hypothetical protein
MSPLRTNTEEIQNFRSDPSLLISGEFLFFDDFPFLTEATGLKDRCALCAVPFDF